jgi:hypothetical protein
VDEELIVTLGETFELIATFKLLPVPVPHELIGETKMLPPTVPKFKLTAFVPAPETTTTPDGRVQL